MNNSRCKAQTDECHKQKPITAARESVKHRHTARSEIFSHHDVCADATCTTVPHICEFTMRLAMIFTQELGSAVFACLIAASRHKWRDVSLSTVVICSVWRRPL